jgi:hypothetical protein
MADLFLHLPADDRREALAVAAASSGRPLHLLDKDVWVVWVLEVLFEASFADHLVFKGGSSLSKAYQMIRRFSEDVDLTYDIRALVPDLAGDDEEPLPLNRSQEKRWTKEIRARLPLWINNQVVPVIHRALSEQRLPATLSADAEKVFIEYQPLAKGSGYTRPTVMLEFGARSTGEPCETRPVRCDAEEHVIGVTFPSAHLRVMRPERTFWEKATAIHVFCAQGEFRGGERFARHWHDVTRLDSAGVGEAAIANRALALAVARHKAIFFAAKNASGAVIDYRAAVSGTLNLVPRGKALESLSLDYAHMVNDGLLLDEAEPFDELLERCRDLQERANRTPSEDPSSPTRPAAR